MIQINLVPDVKQELIKAQRIRSSVISAAILVGIVAAGIVVVLCVWVFGVQTARSVLTDNTIKSESQKLAEVKDVGETLTVQNQLGKLQETHDVKLINSRLFDVLSTINPPAPNDISITKLTLDSSTSSAKIEAQALGGYTALETFKKTITATKLEYTDDSGSASVTLANSISDGDRSTGENQDGAKVLRFTLTFQYPAELFARTTKDAKITAPTKSNVTDSYLGVPQSLFSSRATDARGGN